MKQNTVLIGGGVIATHYRKGFDVSETLNLVALVDLNPDCVARGCFAVPFYSDVNAALALKPQAAILALPVTAHDDIARKLISHGVNVVTEKPMFESMEALEATYAYAESQGVSLSCMFHWKAADEVRFIKDNLNSFGKIRSISSAIFDDYAATADGSIRPDRLGLMGAWIDSGINILSYYDEIIDLSCGTLVWEDVILDPKSGQAKYAEKVFDFNGVKAKITVDWRKKSNKKTSHIECEKGTLFVDHSAQTVYLNDEIIFSNPVADRLSSHYENLFKHLSPESASAKKSALLLHKLLFTGNAK